MKTTDLKTETAGAIQIQFLIKKYPEPEKSVFVNINY